MIVFRTDIKEFLLPNVGALRELLNQAELPDDFELMWNDVGNLAICEPGEGTHGPTRWYVGYIDLALLEVHVMPGLRHRYDAKEPPPWPAQYPFDSKDVRYVDGRGHDVNAVRDGQRLPER